MGRSGTEYRILVGEPEVKRPIGRRRRCGIILKWNLDK
jgi:hypothetical protein